MTAVTLSGVPASPPPARYAFPSPDLVRDEPVDDGSYLIRISGDPGRHLADDVVDTIMAQHPVVAQLEDQA